jgi:hypothetical protein
VHGGGKRCLHPGGCDKSAVGQTVLCIAHGGGNRCRYPEGCDKLVKKKGMCKSHSIDA